jgi:hypothetical protein
VATGSSALFSNQTGGDNTATGVNALYANTGNYNTATGYQALESNTTGSNNTAHGLNALNANTSGSYNTANGASALFSNTIGTDNTAEGELALYQNTTGSADTALGQAALTNNTSGFQNTALGTLAASNLSTGSNNIAVGFEAGMNLTTGSNNIEIGNLGVAGESGVIRIGIAGTQSTTFIAGITGVPITGSPVAVSTTGQLGVRVSSARFKEKIAAMNNASEALFALQPVTFRYKHELDPEGIPQFGLVAEQVEGVAPELVTRDDQGKPYTVRYEEVNAMLLNEFLKKHRQDQEEQGKIEELEATVANLESLLSQQDAQIQKWRRPSPTLNPAR